MHVSKMAPHSRSRTHALTCIGTKTAAQTIMVLSARTRLLIDNEKRAFSPAATGLAGGRIRGVATPLDLAGRRYTNRAIAAPGLDRAGCEGIMALITDVFRKKFWPDAGLDLGGASSPSPFG
jgi:hypothetical protein